MTTDITELAQRMSIERIKQIALGSTPTMGERESLAITALHFAEELKIATDAFQAAGLAQLAAEEALEKAQKRISQLESRTVNVENLQESAYRAGLTAGWNLGLANNNDGFNKCLAAHAAGIKVEAE